MRRSDLENLADSMNPGKAWREFLFVFLILYSSLYLKTYVAVTSSSLAALVADVSTYLVLPGIVIVILFLFRRYALLEMVLEVKWSREGILFSALLGVAFAYIYQASVTSLARISGSQFQRQVDLPLIVVDQLGLIGVFYLAISAALFEEWLYKFVLIRTFRREPSLFAFVTASAVLFGIPHLWQGPIATVLVTVLYGVPSAIYYYHARNILNVVVVHIVASLLLFGWMWSWNT